MHMLDPEMAIELEETLSQVIPCENPTELMGGDFLRVHVEIDISNLSVEVEGLHWTIMKKSGFHLNMKNYLTFAIGVA